MTCGICCPSRIDIPHDIDGCLLPDGHDGRHQFSCEVGLVSWETDYGCDCPDCVTGDSFSDNCILYTVTPHEHA
jgi:hypothetical protein